MLGLVMIGNQNARGAETSGLGLSVNSVGVLTRNGVPYRGIGVNYYDAFVRTLRNPQDNSYRVGFSKLGASKIPFVRFAAGGYTANDFQLYLTDKEAYFRLLDDVVQSAEKSNVGLIASLFWSVSAVSDAVNEPRERWGDAKSKTRQFMRSYTRDVVSRYSGSPAIWGWEFSCGLIARRSAKSSAQCGQGRSARHVLHDFQKCSTRFCSSGSQHRLKAHPPNREFAAPCLGLQQRRGRCMRPDTEKQFATILLRDNPGPYSPICIHTSPASVTRYFADRKVSYEELFKLV